MAIRSQLREMPREILESQCLMALQVMTEQRRIHEELVDHLDVLRNTLAAASKKPPTFQ
jgi:hypothetical protein